MLSRSEAVASIATELSRLLNTRRGERRGGDEPTVLDYGLPDSWALDPAADADRALLTQWVQAVALPGRHL